MPYDAPPDLAAMSLGDIADALAARRLPPVDQWQPEKTIDSHMTIAADGTWLHEGSPIARKAMVRAFASLLVRDEDGQHWLMTPHVRHSIAVEDAAFRAVDVRRKEDTLVFRLATDEFVVADATHPLRASGPADLPAIYLTVRHGCEARIDRSTWLQLVELADIENDVPVVVSRGTRFALVPE